MASLDLVFLVQALIWLLSAQLSGVLSKRVVDYTCSNLKHLPKQSGEN